jgi:acyl transferase domain-containing protein/NAD(P)H-dependent flavin oxidoreductase YrpB (nitropropane dioxygenase family)
MKPASSATMQVAVLSPPGARREDAPAQLRAAARVGATALFDLTRVDEVEGVLQTLREAKRTTTKALWGLRAEFSCALALLDCLQNQPVEFDLLILAGAEESPVSLEGLRPYARRIFRETVNEAEARRAVEIGCDGIVVKGNESGGRVGGESTFVLLQRMARWKEQEVSAQELEIWAQGGIGPRAARACRVAGASGIVLDAQLSLVAESVLPRELKSLLSVMDGGETVCLGESLNAGFRVHARIAPKAVEELQRAESAGAPREEFQSRLRKVLNAPEGEALWPVGQDGALAASLAAKYHNVAGILRAYRRAWNLDFEGESGTGVLSESGSWARAHQTQFAIAQGPMTRVSDVAPFASEVARNGALPFLALALLKENAVEKLLQETSTLLGDLPWGVGILGFAPPELREAQLRAVMKNKPRFALLAGGRPSQAAQLEDAGIATYIHAPSPRLLQMFLQEGARRFVFEGRECGGHVGPLSSFLLWQQALEVLLQFQEDSKSREPIDILLAGGIHDARSAAMAVACLAPTMEKNVRVGVLMGTAYLFTREAVESGAIVASFQDEAVRCNQTVLLDAAGGHAIRCAPTPYADEYATVKKRLLAEGFSNEAAREQLEMLNVGRLRLAAKGVERDASTAAPQTVALKGQKQRGMFMLGAVAGLRDATLSMNELHCDVALGSHALLHSTSENLVTPKIHVSDRSTPTPIAIVGMACLYPDAHSAGEFWRNVSQNHDAIREVPASRWKSEVFYEKNTKSPDRSRSQWGGFLTDIIFDPLRFGLPPSTLASIEPAQLLMLEICRRALDDCRLNLSSRERTGVVIGTGGGLGDLALAYTTRCMAEHYLHESDLDEATRERALDALRSVLPTQTEDSFSGTLHNVTAGRVSNRFDLGGPNFTVDAACASSLAALETAVKELRAGGSDAMLVGAIDTQQSPISFLSFSNTHALSPSGRCRPFDAAADGIATSEGLAAVVLKRLDDAERDGDKIYAVIRHVAGGSDGREKSLTAPSSNGQRRALNRAYEPLEFSPADVGLIEAHGTGTVVGDRTEAQSLQGEWGKFDAANQSCALGSVKSQIGHTKNAAGLAGLIKTTLALHHRVLPPSRVENPAPALRERAQPFYLNTRVRPWIAGNDAPRRAGVSAFGFGGTNFHAVLEEYSFHAAPTSHRNAHAFFWRAASREKLNSQMEKCAAILEKISANPHTEFSFMDFAATLAREAENASGDFRFAIVARDVDELRARLNSSHAAMEASTPQSKTSLPPGAFYGDENFAGKVAVVFPGQGSQFPAMLEELATSFPVVRETFERADRALSGVLDRPLSNLVFPAPAYDEIELTAQRELLNQTQWAQPALGATDFALWQLLQELGIDAGLFGGHSYGEYVALCAGGAFDFETLLEISAARGRIAADAQGQGEIGMLAVRASRERVLALLKEVEGVHLASHNAPAQVVVGGKTGALETFAAILEREKISSQKLALSAGFHIPEAGEAANRFGAVLDEYEIHAPPTQVFANRSAAPHAGNAAEIRRTLLEHLTHPLRFVEQIEAMHEAGARVFLEVGPKGVLGALVKAILEHQIGEGGEATVISCNRGENALGDFLSATAQLWARGVMFHPSRLFAGAARCAQNLEAFLPVAPSKSAWLVDGGRARPLNATPTNVGQSDNLEAPRTLGEKPKIQRANPTTTAAPIPTQTTPRVLADDNFINDAMKSNYRESAPRAASTPHAPSLPASASAAALSEFQETMRQFLDHQAESQRARTALMTRFLETQHAVLNAALGGAPLETSALAPAAPSSPAPVAAPIATSIETLSEISEIVTANGHVVNEHTRNGHAENQHAQNGIGFTPETNEPAVVGQGTANQSSPLAAFPAHESLDLRELVLETVAARTGYPSEMLDLDHNMEADLGIDSIKRTEIFGGLRERLGLSSEGQEQEEYFIRIAGLRTLREVIAWLETQRDAGNSESETLELPTVEPQTLEPACVEVPAVATIAAEYSGAEILRRCVVAPAAAPPGAGERATFSVGALVLLTEDAGGRARELAVVLRASGARVVTMRHAPASAGVVNIVEAGSYELDLSDREAVGQMRARILENEGAPAVLCHLLPLETPRGTDPQNALEMQSLLLLAQAFGPELRAARGAILSVTARDGRFGFDEQNGVEEFRPGAAAVAGFLKSLSNEWLEVGIKALDVALADDPEILIPLLVSEIEAFDAAVEVGVSSRGRVVLEAREQALDALANPQIELDEHSVVLVTGGARGISGAISVEMARCSGCRLVLVGRTPLETESALTANVPIADLRRVLAAHCAESGEAISPPILELRFRALAAAREVRAHLETIRQLGAPCEYFALDARDPKAFSGLIENIYAKHGRLDGVIHGAGVIEDTRLENKTLDSFHRVFDTKVLPALTLARNLRPDELKFLFFFSSIAVRMGNPGQSDYTAANETLNRLATHLDGHWPARVAALGWGPWSEIGMAPPHLREKLQNAGLEYSSPAAGIKAFFDELAFGCKGESEVLWFAPFGDGPKLPTVPQVKAEAENLLGLDQQVVTLESAFSVVPVTYFST